MTVSILVLLLAFAGLEWKLKGMQWVGWILGAWTATAALTAPDRGVIGDLCVDSLAMFQEVIQKISDALAGSF